MSTDIKRLYVEKKKPYAVEAKGLLQDLKLSLGITGLTGVRIINRYDVMGLEEDEFALAKQLVLSEPPVDTVYEEVLPLKKNARVFSVELLPGQYDQREDFAEQCVQAITQKAKPTVSAAKVYVLEGQLTDKEFKTIKNYCINPVEAREALGTKPTTLTSVWEEAPDVAIFSNFNKMTKAQLSSFLVEQGLAMSLEDLAFVQKYFKSEHRAPTITEIKVLDTYWPYLYQ